MHGDALGVLLSVLLIALCLALAYLISRFGKRYLGETCSEVSRKVVHIGVSNWFFIYALVFDGYFWPVAGLLAFAVLNFLMNISGGFGSTMGQQKSERQWGLVQYPISIVILIVLQRLGLGNLSSVGCAVLGMGYGDGLAAIAGLRFGKRKLNASSDKSIVGSVVMLAVTFIVFMAMKLWLGSDYPLWLVALCGVATAMWASIVEAITPLGLDNLSVPIVIFLLAGLV